MSSNPQPAFAPKAPRFDEWEQSFFDLIDAPAQLRKSGLPRKVQEEWRYTGIDAALRSVAPQFATIDYDTNGFVEVGSAHQITPFTADKDHQKNLPMADLANCFSKTLSFVSTLQPSNEPQQAHMRFSGKGEGVAMTRTLIQVPSGSTQILVEHVDADAGQWLNQSNLIHVQVGGKLLHLVVQTGSDTSVVTRTSQVKVDTEGQYSALHIAKDCGLLRQETHIRLIGEQAKGQAYALILGCASQTIDQTVRLYHEAPNCQSDQFVRTILADKAQGVFQGKIFVDQIAQRTDGYQLSNTVLLSPLAAMQTKPELEIYADDVKCSHGATTGPLDEDALFYLRSRGLPEKMARRLVLTAFCADVLARIEDETLIGLAEEALAPWLDQRS
jgi:FeS assembly protein SufD